MTHRQLHIYVYIHTYMGVWVYRYALGVLLALVREAPSASHLQALGVPFLTDLLRESHGACGQEAEAIISVISQLQSRVACAPKSSNN